MTVARFKFLIYTLLMDENTLKTFTDYCTRKNLRITLPRLNTFEIVCRAVKPITAYEVLKEMRQTHKNPQPPTAYRALDFLEKHRFIHRIESLNAYVSCDVNHRHSGSQFMICDSCGHVTEIHLCSLPQKLQDKVDQKMFRVSHWNVELHGSCVKCDI